MLVAEGQQSNFGALHETWETSNSVRRADGHTLAFFNPYFQVRLPSRFHDPAMAPMVGRPIDVCYEVTAAGERASGGPCDRVDRRRAALGVTFDDPRSAFNGADHFVDINANTSPTPTGRRSGTPMPSAGTADRAVPRLDPPAHREDGQQHRRGRGRPGDRRRPELRGPGVQAPN